MSFGANAVRTTLSTTLATLYTVPTAKIFDIRCITVVNRDENNAALWWLYLVASGGSADNTNILIPGTSQWEIPAGKNIDYDTWKVLSAGQTIQGYCNGSCTIHIDGALMDA